MASKTFVITIHADTADQFLTEYNNAYKVFCSQEAEIDAMAVDSGIEISDNCQLDRSQ